MSRSKFRKRTGFLFLIMMCSSVALPQERRRISKDKPIWEQFPAHWNDDKGRTLTAQEKKKRKQYGALRVLPGVASRAQQEYDPESTAKHLKWAGELFDLNDPADQKVLDKAIDMPDLVDGVPFVLNLYGSEGLLWILEKYPSSPVVRKFHILKVLMGFQMKEVYRLLERELDNEEGAEIPRGGEERGNTIYCRMCEGAHNVLQEKIRNQALDLGWRDIFERVRHLRVNSFGTHSADSSLILKLREVMNEERVREMMDTAPSMLNGLEGEKRKRAEKLLEEMDLLPEQGGGSDRKRDQDTGQDEDVDPKDESADDKP